MVSEVMPAAVDVEDLRCQIQDKYTEVANTPEKGFHFHTGRPLALMLGYQPDVVDQLPASAVDSFAGTGNPFSMGDLAPGETVLDIGCGAGFDSLIAAHQVGRTGRVIAVDMTSAMLDKAAESAGQSGLANIEFREGLRRGTPGRRRLNRRGDQQRRHQPLPGQNGRDGRGTPRPEARRPHPDRRYRRTQGGPAVREGRHRPLERLNRRCSAGSRVELGAGAHRLHRHPLGRADRRLLRLKARIRCALSSIRAA